MLVAPFPGAALALPAQGSSVSLADLDQPAQLVRGRVGVPHVLAQTEHDADFLLGYLHGQDRLFQMDVLRRQASGTLAELLGPAALSTDVQLRAEPGRGKLAADRFQPPGHAQRATTRMRPPRDEDAPFIAALYSRDSPEPIPVERVLHELAAPTLDREHEARITDSGFVMLRRQGERAWLRLAGEVTPELLAWAEGRAREVGVTRLLAATWDVGGATAKLLESSGYSQKAFSLRMRIDVEGRAFSPRFPEGIAVRTFREGDAERVYRTHLETFQDVSEPARATFEEWSHSLLQPPLFHPDLWFLGEDGDELAGIALCDPHPTAAGVGHVGVLGVRAPWRGRGLGLALLEHAFAAFEARGFHAVILGAEADSPTGANRLYERAGMRITHRRARYEKLLV